MDARGVNSLTQNSGAQRSSHTLCRDQTKSQGSFLDFWLQIAALSHGSDIHDRITGTAHDAGIH